LRTRCPNCDARYEVATRKLLDSDGLARCWRCETVFDALAGGPAAADADIAGKPVVDLDAQAELTNNEADVAETPELPFAVPEDLEPLQASAQDALGVEDTLYQKRSRRGLFYGLAAVVLIAALGLQLAWQQREQILAQFPQLEVICGVVACRPSLAYEPERFRILQREIKPTANLPGSLTLSAVVRNEAELPQLLPDLQLSLTDNNGGLLIRRRLSPSEYLFPAPAEDKLVDPGEVITIALDFEDPGSLATGFQIDFL
jgi:predicted Zn finger-like uncharacterized protein